MNHRPAASAAHLLVRNADSRAPPQPAEAESVFDKIPEGSNEHPTLTSPDVSRCTQIIF